MGYNLLDLTPAQVRAMTDQERKDIERDLDRILTYNHGQLPPGPLYRLDCLRKLIQRINRAAEIKRQWEQTYPGLIKDIQRAEFPVPDQLAGLSELCAAHNLFVNYGSGWGVSYRGVYVQVSTHDRSKLGGSLRQDYPEFMAAIDQVNAEWESGHDNQSTT